MGDADSCRDPGYRGLCSDAQAGKVVVAAASIRSKSWGAQAPIARFAVLFVIILVTLFAAELTPPVQSAVVLPWTEALVRISRGLVTLFDSRVIAVGKILQSTSNGFSISIEAGCNGIEVAIILIAAMLAFPAPGKHRVIGILVGLFAVQALNVVRVVSLFYLGQWNVKAFEWAHLYLWQALIMLDVLVVWLIWIRTLPPNAGERQAAVQ